VLIGIDFPREKWPTTKPRAKFSRPDACTSLQKLVGAKKLTDLFGTAA